MKLLTFVGLLISLNIFAQNSQTVKVHLSDGQSRLPIAGATVSIPKYKLSASTDTEGNVRFDAVPLGRLEVEVSSVEYGKYIYRELLLENSRQLVLDLELQVTGRELEEVKVTSSTPPTSALMNAESITTEQIMRFPATFFDPARLAMSFAGVANTNDQANNVSVRGNAPEFVQWRLEGVEIVNPNHLSNAGMFSDKPAAVGGGTNILSAQMLGNMNFLTSAFPAGYSNALAGVFDMNLRTGNSEKYQHVVQAGLLGVDLSSEGPINQKKGSSYLINYRYSFTGLLALAGVNFGGEAITFQDVAFNLNFPTRKAGTFTFFGVGGVSSNTFAPDADSTTWESSKDFNNVDFYGRMGLLGAKHSVKLLKRWNLRTVLVNSGQETLRNAYSGNINVDYDYSARNFLSFSTALSGDLNRLWAVHAGVQLSHQFNRFNYIDSDAFFFNMANLLVQPHVRITNRQRSRFNYNAGFAAPYYSYSKSQYFEPRLSADYYLSSRHKVMAAYGLHSQVTSTRVSFYLPYKPARSHHFTLGYQFEPDTRQSFSAELFYQNMFNLTRFDSAYVSVLNGYEVGYFNNGYYLLNQKDQGRNYGVGLNYKRYLDKGFFALLNATFYKSQFKAFDGKFYDTRYAGNYIYNATAGKEWEISGGNLWGLNARLNWVGGFRDYKIITEEKGNMLYVYFNYGAPLNVKYDDYFRLDIRAYIKRPKKRGSETISLDIQNLTNRENAAYNYFDTYLMKVVQKKQLGLIPMLNYRWEF